MKKLLLGLLAVAGSTSAVALSSCGVDAKDGRQVACASDSQIEAVSCLSSGVSHQIEGEEKIKAAISILLEDENVIENVEKLLTITVGTNETKSVKVDEALEELAKEYVAYVSLQSTTDLDFLLIDDTKVDIKRITIGQIESSANGDLNFTDKDTRIGYVFAGVTGKKVLKKFDSDTVQKSLNKKVQELKLKVLLSLQNEWTDTLFYKQVNSLVTTTTDDDSTDETEKELQTNPMFIWGYSARTGDSTATSVETAQKIPGQSNFYKFFGKMAFTGLQTKEHNSLPSGIFDKIISDDDADAGDKYTVSGMDKVQFTLTNAPIKINDTNFAGFSENSTTVSQGNNNVLRLLMMFAAGENSESFDSEFNLQETYDDFMDDNVKFTQYNHA